MTAGKNLNLDITIGSSFDNLPEACANGDNLEAREAMAMASYYGGLAITNALVGSMAGSPGWKKAMSGACDAAISGVKFCVLVRFVTVTA